MKWRSLTIAKSDSDVYNLTSATEVSKATTANTQSVGWKIAGPNLENYYIALQGKERRKGIRVSRQLRETEM